jgi:hypothetical protein
MFGKEVIGIVIGMAISISMGIMLISIFFYATNAATTALPKINETTVLGQIYYSIIEGFKGIAVYFPLLLMLGVIGLVAFIALALYQVWERSGAGAGGRTRLFKLVPAHKVYVVYAKIPARFFYWY